MESAALVLALFLRAALGVDLSELFLVAVRLGPLFVMLPFWSQRVMPPVARVCLWLMLSILSSTWNQGSTAVNVVSVSTELFWGLTIGAAASSPFWVMEMVGRSVDQVRGQELEGGGPFGTQSSTSASLLTLCAVVIFFSSSSVQLFLVALHRMFDLFPVGSAIPQSIALRSGLMVVQAVLIGASLLGPFLGAILVVDIGGGLIGRSAPAWPIHFALPVVRSAVGLAVLAISLEWIARVAIRLERHALDFIP